MEPQREIGNHHRAGLRPAQSDLVIRFGIGSRGMYAEDRQSLRRGPPQAPRHVLRAGRPRRPDQFPPSPGPHPDHLATRVSANSSPANPGTRPPDGAPDGQRTRKPRPSSSVPSPRIKTFIVARWLHFTSTNDATIRPHLQALAEALAGLTDLSQGSDNTCRPSRDRSRGDLRFPSEDGPSGQDRCR